MKFAWNKVKGVGLLLLGMAAAGGGRSTAADIYTTSFAVVADGSSASTAATPTTKQDSLVKLADNPVKQDNPFKDDTAGSATTGPATTGAAKALPALPADVSMPETNSPAVAAGVACSTDCDCFSGAPGRIWFRGEFVHWWTSGANLPPLVSTLTGQNGNVPATVFGNESVYDGDHDGYRMSFGYWLDRCHCWGLEADYLDISGKQTNYDSGFTDGYTNGAVNPIVRIVFDPAAAPNLQTDFVGFAGFFNGRITVETSNYFQSAGITLRRQLRASEWSICNHDVDWMDPSARTFRLDALGGYRFARLIDSVNEQDNSFEFNPNQPNYLYDYTYTNNYRTVNDFNGGELGLNAVYTVGRWSFDVVGKCALGVNNQYVSLYNQETINVSNARGIATPIQVVNPSPQQEFSRNQFSAIPELMVTAGYQVTEHFKVTVGYDLLYWTAVVRTPEQIAVEPTTGFPYGTVVGNYGTLPPFSFNESHYLANGIRVGGEFRF